MKMRWFLILAASVIPGIAQSERGSLSCDDRGRNDRMERHCEIKEWTLQPTGRVEVDGRENGGVSVKGWDKPNVLLRVRVEAQSDTIEQARAVVNQVQVATSGVFRAHGPSSRRDEWWSVSYEVFVPRETSLALQTQNGGISISDVKGRIEFEAVNGGVSLKRLGGDVHGRTVNGGLSIELAGARWDGTQLDAKTSNGGVNLSVPAAYSAQLETGTVNGNIRVDFPVTVSGSLSKQLSLTLGSGGPPIKVHTTNGGVNVKRI